VKFQTLDKTIGTLTILAMAEENTYKSAESLQLTGQIEAGPFSDYDTKNIVINVENIRRAPVTIKEVQFRVVRNNLPADFKNDNANPEHIAQVCLVDDERHGGITFHTMSAKDDKVSFIHTPINGVLLGGQKRTHRVKMFLADRCNCNPQLMKVEVKVTTDAGDVVQWNESFGVGGVPTPLSTVSAPTTSFRTITNSHTQDHTEPNSLWCRPPLHLPEGQPILDSEPSGR